LRLRLKNLCLLGKSFHEAGFTAVLDDIILGDRWSELQDELRGVPFSLVGLAPLADVVVRQRDLNRAKQPLGAEWAYRNGPESPWSLARGCMPPNDR
jgi:hypothetical protein